MTNKFDVALILGPVAFTVYEFIKCNPGCTKLDVWTSLGISDKTMVVKLRELKREGFITMNRGINGRSEYYTRKENQVVLH